MYVNLNIIGSMPLFILKELKQVNW